MPAVDSDNSLSPCEAPYPLPAGFSSMSPLQAHRLVEAHKAFVTAALHPGLAALTSAPASVGRRHRERDHRHRGLVPSLGSCDAQVRQRCASHGFPGRQEERRCHFEHLPPWREVPEQRSGGLKLAFSSWSSSLQHRRRCFGGQPAQQSAAPGVSVGVGQ